MSTQLRPHRPWTPAEDTVVLRYARGELTSAECGTLLGRTAEAVRKRASRTAPARVSRVDSWDAEEDATLARLRQGGASWADIAAELGRSVDAVKSRAKRKLAPSTPAPSPAPADTVPDGLIDAAALASLPLRRPWAPEEDDLLAETYGPEAPCRRDDAVIAAVLHRPIESIQRRAAIIGLAPLYPPPSAPAPAPAAPPRHYWSPHDDTRLRRAWPDGDVQAIADLLGVDAVDVRRRAGQLGLGAPSRPHPKPGAWWTSEEDSYIRAHYAEDGAARIAARLGRPEAAVEERAKMVCAYNPLIFPAFEEDEEIKS